MFHKTCKVPVLLSLFLILLHLSEDVTSSVEPLPMNGLGSVVIGGGVGDGVEMGGATASASTININSATSTSDNDVIWSPRQVLTKLGLVQGFIVQPPNGYPGVEVFLNLPYASSPEGSLRFMPPVSPDPWKGLRRSLTPSPVCPQVLPPNIKNESEALKVMPRGRLLQLKRLLPMLRNQSEDCLYLNIYIPSAVADGKIEGKLPVMVFIHGEDFSYGASQAYDPTMLVSTGNLIVITFNFRLGILGFLNADPDGHFKLPFNFALLDQIAALQWVQENIETFGGDRSRVTLMGHGNGAVMANFLMISNAVPTGLLFHRVILSSGSALSPLTADLSKGPELARKFARKVKCPTEPSSTMLQCLRELPLKYFLESELWNLFGPTADGIVVKVSPSESVIMNRISHYPLIFGVVRAELLPSLNNHDATYGLESERRRELLKQFIRKHYSFHRNEILAGAIHEYTDWEKPAQHPLNVRDETIDALADAQIVAPLTKLGDLHAASSRTKAYFYVFDYQSKNSEYQQRLGCVHGEDLLYIFGAPLYFYENEFAPVSSTNGAAGAVLGASNSHSVDGDIIVDQNGIHTTKTGDIISGSGKNSGDQQHLLLQQRKEKWRKRNERAGGLGFFAGNFTWYEVQLSATVMQLWANFIWTGNPNGDAKSQGKVAHGMMATSSSSSTGGTYHQQQQPQPQQQPPSKGRSSLGKSRKVKDELSGGNDEGKGDDDELLQRGSNNGPSHNAANNNRLRMSRDNLPSAPAMDLELQQQLHHHHYHQPKPIYVEWPEYDALDKKYLIFDLRPKVRNHYRAHKLSFWRFLVPDYQKNYEGTSAVSLHHEISVYGMMPGQNLSKMSVIQPTIFASGLHETAMGLNSGRKSSRYNSSRSGNPIDYGIKRSGSKNNGQARAGGKNKEMGASVPSGDLEERQKQRDSADFHVPSTLSDSMDPLEAPFGFQTYSTALSVTIAIGVSLLILNILIFATFYYEREKRRHEHRRQKQQMEKEEFNEEEERRRHPSHQNESGGSRSTFFRQQSSASLHEKFPIPLTTSSISCGEGGSISASASLKRRRDNNSSCGGGGSSSGGAASFNAMAGSIASGNLIVHPPPSDTGTSKTLFCEHYVDEEINMNVFNDLYTPPYLMEMRRKNGNDEIVKGDHGIALSSLGLEDNDERKEVEGATSSAHLCHSVNDMNYEKYGSCASASSTLRRHGNMGSSSCGSSKMAERCFVPISPAPPCTTSSPPTFSGSLRTPSGSVRQKRKAFAIATSSSSSTGGGACATSGPGCSSGGGLNEFSMSDVMVEPVTNVTNFSPQSSTIFAPQNELFQIENIPTAEELIEAELCNATANSSPTTNNDRGSVATVVIVPDFVSHHESPKTSCSTSTGHVFQNE